MTVVLTVRIHRAGLGRRDQSPRIPRDLEDHERDDQADDGIGSRQPEGHECGARDDPEGHQAIGARVVAVRDEGGARETVPRAKTNLRGQLVADEPDDPCCGECPEMRQILRMDEALDRLVERQADMKIASTTARPAILSARKLRRANAIPSGIAVRASPKL